MVATKGMARSKRISFIAFVRSHRPPKIVQIGSGVSTAVRKPAAAKDEGYSPRIICIEPYPTEFLKRESAAGGIELVAKKVEDVGAECASWVNAGDLFFVDSSHTLAPAGEVNLIVFEMLPALAPGVHIHFHDIYFPLRLQSRHALDGVVPFSMRRHSSMHFC